MNINEFREVVNQQAQAKNAEKKARWTGQSIFRPTRTPLYTVDDEKGEGREIKGDEEFDKWKRAHPGFEKAF